MAQRLGELLCAHARLTPQALGRGLEEQRRTGGLLGEQLIALNLLEPAALSAALAQQTELQRIEYEQAVPTLAADAARGRSAEGDAAPPLVRLVDALIAYGVVRQASDIHIEPTAEATLVRYRVHGLLASAFRLPKGLHPALVSRVKILAALDIAERRLPQDGAVRGRHAGHAVDLRISSLPSQHGETVVIRVLDHSRQLLNLNALGLTKRETDAVHAILARRKGIILVTGPTGSGKTTTLYAMLNAIRDGTTNIVTVEDPIEYSITGVNQVQVNVDSGLTFARALRAILRQDPDVVLIGEIRDGETAEIAYRAAMTGHLVLSTLHTNDAPATIARLTDLGVPRYLVAAHTGGILAQRLVRALCPACRVQGRPALADALHLGLPASAADDATWWLPRGCDACNGGGYRGRLSLFESLLPSRELREHIATGAHEQSLRMTALRTGMVSLLAAGLAKAGEGLTSLEELARVLEPDDGAPPLCDACGKIRPGPTPYCPLCGARATGSCAGCGDALAATWTHCASCGTAR
ncbi:MAG TPA: ATPase, T2SS/T4P/T4SS family [Nitrospiria bacterium]|nr:ATPase, T2SS/T4P/T4SS family [Nitrospiria bacterium]